MKSVDVNLHQPSFWQLVFLQSKVNGAAYNGEALPRRSWDWPKDTYYSAAWDGTGIYVLKTRDSISAASLGRSF